MVDAMKQDPATVNAQGDSLTPLPEGVRFRRARTISDDRGTVCEIFDPRWGWHDDPLVFVYTFSLRPGKIKGWGLHKEHEDRYFVISGEMEVVMYDVREDSPTKGLVSKFVLSEYERGLLCIPTNVWHANVNIGSKDTVVVNFPTKPYNHEAPDKYRLPLDTDQIPYKFEHLRGW